MVDVLRYQLQADLRDRYRLERELGRGGMGIVYLAEDLKHHRQVALKVLRPELAGAVGAERFLREIEVAARLAHPHVLPMLDSGAAAGLLYYVMPYVEGESLRVRLAREGPLPVLDAVRILRDLVDAVAGAHAHGVVHRDIKPDNVLLLGRHALVTDFGVAKALSQATTREHLTTPGVAVGTPEYMAPEQAAADPHVDHRADLYAVGIVAYEMLAGRPPFTGTSAESVLAAQVLEAPQPLRKHREHVPEELERVVLKCLAKKPADRWQTAEELLERLDTLLTPTDARAVAAPTGRRARWTVAAGAVLFLAAAGGALLLRGGHQRIAGRTGVHRQVTFTGKITHVALSPDGRMLAYASRTAGSRWKLSVQDLTGGRPVDIDSFAFFGGVGSVDWSPDGTRLAVTTPGGGLGIVPRFGGTWRWLPAVGMPRWSPDGSRLANWSYPSKGIKLVEVATGDSSLIPLLGSFEWLAEVAWSPSGDRLVFQTASPGRYVIGTIRTDGSAQQEVIVDSMPLHGLAWAQPGDVIYYRRGDEVRKVSVSREGARRGDPETLFGGGGELAWWLTRSLSVSADASRLTYIKSAGYSNLWLATLEGSGAQARWKTKQLTTGTAARWVPAISPDGRWVAYVEAGAGESDVFVLPLEGGPSRRVTTVETVLSMEYSVAWSPDGQFVAFGAPVRGVPKVWIAPSAGGPARAFAGTELSETGSVAWAPAREILYHRPGNRNFHFLDPATGEEHPLVANDSVGFMFDPRPSPDGRRVAVLWYRKGTGLWVVERRGGAQVPLRAGAYRFPIGWSGDGSTVYAVYGEEIEDRDSLYLHAISLDGRERTLVIPLNCGEHVAITPDGRRVVCAVEQSVSDAWLVEDFDPARKSR